LNSLRAFEAAARHLSFKNAADELNVTTAAVSQQVKTLEHYLGVTLFHRLNRGLALTEAGLAGQPLLQQAFCMLSKGVASMRGAEEQDLLAVEAAPSFTAKWLLPRLACFYTEQPGIDLRIAGSLDQIDTRQIETEVREHFRNGHVDVAIRFGGGSYPGCRVDRLFRVAAVPLCSPSLLSGRHPLRSPRDLEFHTLLHDDTPWEGRPDWAAWLAAAGVSELPAVRGPHFNSVQLALQAAMAGQGVALGIEALAADDITDGHLIVPFDIRLPLDSAYHVVTLEEEADLPQVAAFRAWVLREAAQFRRDFPEPIVANRLSSQAPPRRKSSDRETPKVAP
jgi:LysR family glycine cleavage system transcriptional activator